jgi:regulator of RNase E activity RraA
VWGGILSVGAAARSVRGVVADGAYRDVAQARGLGFPVFARARGPVTASRIRAAEGQTNGPLADSCGT